MKKFAKMAVAAAIIGFSFAASADVVIDDFNVGQAVGPGPGFAALLRDNTADGSGFWNSATGATTSILGGERDIFIQSLTTDGAGAAVGTNVSGGLLKYSTDTGASGQSILKWDGQNSTTGATVQAGTQGDYLATLDIFGLNNFNLAATGSGFKIKVKESDLGFDFALTVYTDATHWTTLILASEAHANYLPDNTPIDFADFEGAAGVLGSGAIRIVGSAGSADMSDVGAILAIVNFSGGSKEIDLQIGDFSSVPEPESLALVGLGLLGLAASRRRKTA